MTDVTGFGLAGHLLGLCEASGLAARLDLAAVPLMQGAAELSARGIRSSLFEENRAIAPALPRGSKADLLFDPQTAGGLLAAVAPETAEEVLKQLQGAGYNAARIGSLTSGAAELCLI